MGLEKLRHESAAESGDDEDEELGNLQVRARSPRRNVKRSSKLGTEMMRTNSQGSVIYAEDAPTSIDPNTDATGTSEPPMIVEEPAAEVEAVGKITPPTMFPPTLLGDGHVEIIDMGAPIQEGAYTFDPNATPRPPQNEQMQEIDPDPTPRANASPQHQD